MCMTMMMDNITMYVNDYGDGYYYYECAWLWWRITLQCMCMTMGADSFTIYVHEYGNR